MFYDCLFSAALQREYLPAPNPTDYREAGTLERDGLLGHQPARPSEITLTSFNSWEARDHLWEGGPSALVLPGLPDPRVGGPVTACP